MQATKHPSVNFGARVGCHRPSLIVLHYTAMETAEAALERLCDPVHEVSAHYLIDRTGALFQMVEDDCRAWHAGAGSWGGAGDVNSRSIGVELDNDGSGPFAEPMMRALEDLLSSLMVTYGIRPEAVIGHQDMAPERKCDPGPYFDWQRLALMGLSVWPESTDTLPVDVERFQADLAAFGYSVPPDVKAESLLTAFRARFRAGAEGVLDALDMALAADLARRFPFDRQTTDT